MTCALRRRFGPQISTGNSNLTPPSSTPPVWTPVTTTVLTYPAASPTLTLTLRNPDEGDEDSLDIRRVDNLSRGGTRHYYRNEIWPKARVLSLGFTGLSDSQVTDFFDFLSASLGKLVGLRDWLNQQWEGVILDPTGNLIDDGINCQGRMSFRFRGTLV